MADVQAFRQSTATGTLATNLRSVPVAHETCLPGTNWLITVGYLQFQDNRPFLLYPHLGY
jgi:hypothetical protein